MLTSSAKINLLNLYLLIVCSVHSAILGILDTDFLGETHEKKEGPWKKTEIRHYWKSCYSATEQIFFEMLDPRHDAGY